MKCPICNSRNVAVLRSRASILKCYVTRRHECLDCKYRFTSYEEIRDMPITVIKRDGARVRYERSKIAATVSLACSGIPEAVERAERVVDDVESDIEHTLLEEVPTSLIKQLVMKRLKKLNPVAYIRYAAVYADFKDADELLDEVKRLATAYNYKEKLKKRVPCKWRGRQYFNYE